ncbi:MAG: Chain length determinant protein, partial [Pseudonocardiales bacterium]|nr:Chain length determinant protein [Pseudonocardiales bacterium]
MTLRAYLRVLRERWLLIVVFVLIATGIALVITTLTPKSYSATAQVLFSSSTSADPSVQAQANAFVTTQVPTFAKVINSPDVLKYI